LGFDFVANDYYMVIFLFGYIVDFFYFGKRAREVFKIK